MHGCHTKNIPYPNPDFQCHELQSRMNNSRLSLPCPVLLTYLYPSSTPSLNTRIATFAYFTVVSNFSLLVSYLPNRHYVDPFQTSLQYFSEASHIPRFSVISPAAQKQCSNFQPYWCYWPCIHLFSASLGDQHSSLVFPFDQYFFLRHQKSRCSSVNFQACLYFFLRRVVGKVVSLQWLQISSDA